MLLCLSGMLLGGIAAACLGWEVADFLRSGAYEVRSLPGLLTELAQVSGVSLGPLLLPEPEAHPAADLLLSLPAWMLFGCPATILLWALAARHAGRRNRSEASAVPVPTPDES